MIIRIADMDDIPQVYKLTYDIYYKNGYCQYNDSGVLAHYSHIDKLDNTKIFIAEENNKIIGTNTLTLDNSVGLPMDTDYSEEMKLIRSFGNHLIASWRLIVENYSLQTTLALMGASMEQIKEWGGGLVVIVVNPKHESFYAKMFGFNTLKLEECKTVKAPGALMIANYKQMNIHWKKFTKGKTNGTI